MICLGSNLVFQKGKKVQSMLEIAGLYASFSVSLPRAYTSMKKHTCFSWGSILPYFHILERTLVLDK